MQPTPPPAVDLRPEWDRYQLGVRQQGKRGACQVFAMVGVIEFLLARKCGEGTDLSEQFLMWAANQATGLERKEGFNPDLLIAGLREHGICRESLMPYVPRNHVIRRPSARAFRDARSRAGGEVLSVKHWSSPIGFRARHFQKITGRLDRGVPVTATFCWPFGLYDEQIVDGHHFLIDHGIDGKSKNGHGVILVGYGLDRDTPGGGYFLLRNSWGPNFADGGHARVTFAYARKYGIDAYVVSVG